MAQYRGWDLEEMKRHRDVNDAQPYPVSAFTAINLPTSGGHITPQPSADTASGTTIAPQPKTRGSRNRARNTAVASYLGIGTATAPSQLDPNFLAYSAPSLPDTPPKSRQVRLAHALGNEKVTTSKAKKSSKKQRQVSGEFRVQKHAVKQLATPRDTPDTLLAVPSSQTQLVQSSRLARLLPIARNFPGTVLQSSIHGQTGTRTACHTGEFQPSQDEDVPSSLESRPPKRVERSSDAPSTYQPRLRPHDSYDVPPSGQGEWSIASLADDSSQRTVEAILPDDGSSTAFIEKPRESFDDEVDEIFFSPEFDDLMGNILTAPITADNAELLPQHYTQTHFDNDALDDGLDDEDLLSLPTPFINHANVAAYDTQDPSPLPTDDHNSNIPPGLDWSGVSSSSATDTSSPRHSIAAFVSPIKDVTKAPVDPASFLSSPLSQPIVRPSFPKPARDRSPVIGLTPNILLRTCFRMGEAIKTGSSAIKHGKSVIIELYARVLSSRRHNAGQHFVFCDLYHKKPPYLNATYNAVIWKSVELFNYDSGRLLQEGRTCRCIGTMKRNGKALELVVLNIWEATWEDIIWVEGILKS